MKNYCFANGFFSFQKPFDGLYRPAVNGNSVTEFFKFLQQLNVNDSTVKSLRELLNEVDENLKICVNFLIDQFQKFSSYNASILVVDVQNDFITGSLRIDMCPAKQDPQKIINAINSLINIKCGLLVATMDWHPENHISFYECRRNWVMSKSSQKQNIERIKLFEKVNFVDSEGMEVEQILWPSHCVANTDGAELFSGLKLPENCIIIKKGVIPDVESYTAFGNGRENTGLEKLLKDANIKLLIICGLAFDVCVAKTAYSAVKLGFRVVVVDNCCAGIDNEAIQKTREEMNQQGIFITHSSKVPEILSGQAIPLIHILHACKNNNLFNKL